MKWLARLVGVDRAPAVAIVAAVLLLIVIGVVFVRACSPRDTTAQQQAEQTSRSGDAIANAAQDAVATITNRSVTEADIDRATIRASEDIANAQDIDAIRSAVLDSVCNAPGHSDDPACKVR